MARLGLPRPLRAWRRCTGRPTWTRPRPPRPSSRALREATQRLPFVAAAPPARPRDAGRGRPRGRARPPVIDPLGLPRLPVAGPRRRGGRHRLGRHPGGDDRAGRALPDAAPQHRAAHHHHAPARTGWSRPADLVRPWTRRWLARSGARATGRRGWDGHAGERIAAVLVERAGDCLMSLPRRDHARHPAAHVPLEPLPAPARGRPQRAGRRAAGGGLVAAAAPHPRRLAGARSARGGPPPLDPRLPGRQPRRATSPRRALVRLAAAPAEAAGRAPRVDRAQPEGPRVGHDDERDQRCGRASGRPPRRHRASGRHRAALPTLRASGLIERYRPSPAARRGCTSLPTATTSMRTRST